LSVEVGDLAEYATYYFQTEGGRAPVEEFIDGLDSAAQRKFFFKRGLLEEFGPRLPQPHAKRLEENLYELRFETHAGQIRVFYFFDGKRIILVHAMKKKTQKLPAQELAIAVQRKNAYLAQRQ
jgi:phage-related protein